MPPKQTDPHFKIRLDPRVKAWLRKQALLNNRTMTAEICFHLQRARQESEAPTR